ncbi:MAG: nucleotidyltransferase family protein, partial [Candidatus Baltobacteraceae bacterium]
MSALQASAPNKAFVRIAGRALVGRTIEGLRGTPRIGRIVVVAPAGSHGDPALAGADERRDDGARMTDSLRSGLRGAPADELLAIVASDLPILSAAAVDDFLDRAESSGADVVYACVERRTHASRFPEV